MELMGTEDRFFEGRTLRVDLLTEEILQTQRFVTLRDTRETFVYDSRKGIYLPDGETLVEEISLQLLGKGHVRH
jgi:hypothetical protein